MKRKIIFLVALALAVTLVIHWRSLNKERAARQKTVRCAVIGGFTMTGLWPEISKMFEA